MAEDEGRVSKTVTWVRPHRDTAKLSQLSGLKILQAIVEGELPEPPICALMNFRFARVEHGSVSFSGWPGGEHYNPIGSVHGGFAATLLDSAMACAIHSTLDPGIGYTTVELSVNYLKAISAETREVRCDGQVIHVGRRVASAEGRLYAARDEKLLAHGKTTAIILS
jgi:uncharacterized protein (TIGR00369 family)